MKKHQLLRQILTLAIECVERTKCCSANSMHIWWKFEVGFGVCLVGLQMILLQEFQVWNMFRKTSSWWNSFAIRPMHKEALGLLTQCFDSRNSEEHAANRATGCLHCGS